MINYQELYFKTIKGKLLNTYISKRGTFMFKVKCGKCNDIYNICRETVRRNIHPRYHPCKRCLKIKNCKDVISQLKDFGYEVLTPVEEFADSDHITFKQRKLMDYKGAYQLLRSKNLKLKRDLS